MMSNALRNLALGTSIGGAVAGGVFLGFSTFVMKALGKLPAPQAISAMQSINKYAPTPLFMTAIFGTAAACVPLAISGFRNLDDPSSKYLLIGAGVYLAGVVLTVAYHVPRNDALNAIDPTASGSAEFWRGYLRNWTAWNHVRTFTSIAGAASLVVATRVG